MTLAEAFAITAEERARLDAAPFRGTDEDGWRAFASAIHEQVVAAYANGEITLERALQVVRSCSIGCRPLDRITLFVFTADRALRNPPPVKQKRNANPLWLRNSAATLIDMFREDRPDEPFAPNDLNEWSTPILVDTKEWLLTLGLCERVSTRTLYRWWLARKDTQSNSTSTA